MFSWVFDLRKCLLWGCIGILVASVVMICPSEGLSEDGVYLLELKKSIIDPYNFLSNWNPNDHTPCNWTGVNCTSHYNPFVRSLDLNSQNLSGALNFWIGSFTYLTFIDLSFNAFTGSLDKEIGNCSSLEILNLNDNKFDGEIPVEFGNLSHQQADPNKQEPSQAKVYKKSRIRRPGKTYKTSFEKTKENIVHEEPNRSREEELQSLD